MVTEYLEDRTLLSTIDVLTLDETRVQNVGGVNLNFETGNGYATVRNDLLNPANFGPSGTVPHTVNILPGVSSLTPANLAEVEVVVLPYVSGGVLDSTEISVLSDFLNAGGGLLTFGNDAAPDLAPMLGAIGDDSGSDLGEVSNSASPMVNGLFGAFGAGTNINHGFAKRFTSLGPNGTDAIRHRFMPGFLGATFTIGAGRAAVVADEEIFNAVGGLFLDPRLTPVNEAIFMNSFAYVSEQTVSVDLDFGDAPDSYPTTLGEDGARHAVSGPTLGANRDSEPDGTHSANADADDTTGTPDDEDGVVVATLSAADVAAGFGSVDINLQSADPSSNRLDAWIDFNIDGDWNDPGEQIFNSFSLGTTNGVQSLNFPIPTVGNRNIKSGDTFGRFRLSTDGGHGVTGEAADGEVEDVPVVISDAPDRPIIDNDDPGFSTFVRWSRTSDPRGFRSDVRSRPAGSGRATATWDFLVNPGTYLVSATWTPFSNRATNAPFVINNGVTLGRVTVNQQLAPNDRTDAGHDWEDLSVFTVNGNRLTVTLSDDADGRVVADAIRVASTTVLFGLTHTDGDTTVDENGSTDTVEVVLFEQPATDVVLDVSSDDPGEATVSPARLTFTNANWNQPQLVTVTGVDDDELDGPVESTLTIEVIPELSDDSFDNEDCQSLSIVTLDNEAAPAIIDNGDAGFSTFTRWSRTANSRAFQNDQHSRPAGAGIATATWTFAVAPGTYAVSTTWQPFANRATDAPFTVFDGVVPLATIDVNQQFAPNDLINVDGANWESLGTFTMIGSQLTVQLSDDADGRVIADAIRIEPVSPGP